MALHCRPTAAAAREIKTLVGRSVEQVELGTAIVRRAGSSIEDIVTSARNVHHLQVVRFRMPDD